MSGGRQRPQLLITAPLEVLERRAGRAVVHGANGTISADAVRRLCCDANVHRIITDGASAILDFGRSVRTATIEQFKALAVRDGGCVIPVAIDHPDGAKRTTGSEIGSTAARQTWPTSVWSVVVIITSFTMTDGNSPVAPTVGPLPHPLLTPRQREQCGAPAHAV
jgi:Domain of unknown function (DUF222)